MKTKNYLCAILTVAGSAFASQPMLASASELNLPGVMMQQQAVRGIVTDAHGEPIVGATIVVVGKTTGAITDTNGRFTLSVDAGTQLKISYVGYKTVTVRARDNMQVALEEDAGQLSEVVVVGYGTQKKANLTGAVANVDVKEAIASRPITDVGKALQGVTPGLTITNKIGGVGTESTIKLRGSVGSLNASSGTSPLILVDNVEVPSLNLVNPDDIETISVLKDASSASIYGTRAAWGVILITTKQGAANDKVRVSYSNNFAWNTPTVMPKLASASDNADYIWRIMQSEKLTQKSNIGYTIDQYAINKIKEWEQKYGGMSQDALGEMQEGRDFEIVNGKTYFYRSFDPVKEFTHKWTPQQNHSLSITGGNKNTQYNISLSRLGQKGVMKFNTDKYDRYTLHSNITTAITKWWKVRTNILLTRSKNEEPYRFTSGQYDAWFYLLRWPRWYPYADYKGKPFRSAVTDIKNGNRESVTSTYVRANLGTELNPMKNLSVNFDYTFSYANDAQKRNGGTVYAYNMFATSPFNSFEQIYSSYHDAVTQNSMYTTQHIFKGYVTYQFNLLDKHNFKLMGGFDAEKRESLGHHSKRQGLISQDLPEIALASGDQYSFERGSSYHTHFAAAGFFGRINYDYMQRYLFELNARYDGSSRFPVGKKFAFFPSASAGWRMSEEKFMHWASPVLSNLKLRGSWGTIGNQDVAPYSFMSVMAMNYSGWVVGGKNMASLNTPSVISPTLTWERVTTLDFGVDAAFFDNDLKFTFDWYRRVTSDMHTAGEALPATFGAKVPKVNYGELTGKGFELGVNYQHLFKNGLGVSLGASLSHVTEEITKFNAQDRNIYGNYQGKRLGEIWGYTSDRLFQKDDFDENGKLKEGIASQALFESGNFKFEPGDVKYKDLDKDDKITYGKNTVEDHGDLSVIGNELPNFEYSFNLGASYKGFDVSLFFQGVGKRDYWPTGAVGIAGGGSGYMDAAFDHQMDYWTPEHTDAFYPRPVNMAWTANGKSYLRQTRFLEDMSYLRCKNITVGYTLPTKWVQKAYFQSFRIYFSGENLFEFDNMKLPLDPESTNYKAGYGNSSWSFGRSYPYTRTLSFGVQAVF